MNEKNKTLTMALAAIGFLGLMILWMAGAFEDQIAPGSNPAKQKYSGPVLNVQQQDVELYEEVAGTLQSEQSTVVSSQIMARVKKIHVRAGDSVNKGDLLIDLDNIDLKSRVAQARDNRNALQAQLHRAKSHYDRTRNLYAKQSATKANLEMATADYQSIRSQLSAARQRLTEAENALNYSQIRATFSGRVIDRFVENGDMAAPGMKLLKIYDPQALRVVSHVRESLALYLQQGQPLQARVDALQKTVPVLINEIVPAAEPGSRSFLVKSHIDYDAKLLPGMFVRIRIPLGMEKQLLIPDKYIKQVGQLDVVWVVKEGDVQRRFVRLGERHSDGTIKVISGLQEGDKLVAPENL